MSNITINENSIGWHGECTWGDKVYWHECVILPKNKIAVFDLDSIMVLSDDFDFRPIKTERELAIEEMAKVMSKGTVSTYMSVAEKLYDAGYRKNES